MGDSQAGASDPTLSHNGVVFGCVGQASFLFTLNHPKRGRFLLNLSQPPSYSRKGGKSLPTSPRGGGGRWHTTFIALKNSTPLALLEVTLGKFFCTPKWGRAWPVSHSPGRGRGDVGHSLKRPGVVEKCCRHCGRPPN